MIIQNLLTITSVDNTSHFIFIIPFIIVVLFQPVLEMTQPSKSHIFIVWQHGVTVLKW